MNEILIEDTVDHKCPYCNLGLLLFQSTNTKLCIECHREYIWDISTYKQPKITRTCTVKQ
jgi:hypothetical protein